MMLVRLMLSLFRSAEAFRFGNRALYERSVSRTENGAERGENRVNGSGAVSGHSRKGSRGSGAWSGRPRSEERVSQK